MTSTQVAGDLADWEAFKEALGSFAIEVTESAVLGCLEPNPISGCYDDELLRVRKAILRARDGKLARFRYQVNRNAFIIGCLEYADDKPEEHLLIGYGFRDGSTTKVESLHHVTGGSHTVHAPHAVAHTMWDFYGKRESSEVLIFHNHPYRSAQFYA